MSHWVLRQHLYQRYDSRYDYAVYRLYLPCHWDPGLLSFLPWGFLLCRLLRNYQPEQRQKIDVVCTYGGVSISLSPRGRNKVQNSDLKLRLHYNSYCVPVNSIRRCCHDDVKLFKIPRGHVVISLKQRRFLSAGSDPHKKLIMDMLYKLCLMCLGLWTC